MDLTLSPNCVRNTTLHLPSGQALYKISTPWKWTARTTTISRVVPNGPAPKHEELSIADDGKSSIIDLQDRWEELAQIEWQCISSSRLKYGMIETDMRTYMPSEGLLARHRVFTAPDGRSYKWTLGMYHSTLELNDNSKTPIARNHRSDMGLLCGRPRPARLEIYPEGVHIADAIVITFAYVEKIRKDRERAAKSG